MIHVFKTSVRLKKEVMQLAPYLNELLRQARWNFDLEDCDRILRIETPRETTETVIKLLQNKGFDCEELPD
ncbi:hypothetical protein [Chryseosolibacter indicus]|uniref:Uncharacterized protein n=1 Tax=Chryseosolibacter indicus TaxID=2782351 RepID=A0ABS5VWC4_9BACT|nr:hypothetical protein [Chryseosolibacter indicus]MBT1705034.1 hypothetical protein [Chryseosolibacter indicus]